MTPALADTIIKAHVEAILANNEPLACLFDENAVAALLKVSPAIGNSSFLETKTLYLIDMLWKLTVRQQSS